jgi:hypothetical protein
MRSLARVLHSGVILAAFALLTIAAEPEQLLKPVTPPASGVRVRIPIDGSKAYTATQLKVRVPKAKSKSGEMIDATVKAYVSSKRWQKWGYEVPANKKGMISELVIPATQLLPKPAKGRDIEVTFTSIAVEIIDPPGQLEHLYGSDIYLPLTDLTRNADRQFQPRLYFDDLFLEMTVPRRAVEGLDTGDGTPAEPAVSDDAKLIPVSGPMVIRRSPVFAFSSINGLTKYKLPDGSMQTVDVAVSSNANLPGGIIMTIDDRHRSRVRRGVRRRQ